MTKKRGRPKLDTHNRKYKGFCVRLTEDEHAEISHRAAEAGVSVSLYIRRQIGLEKKEEE